MHVYSFEDSNTNQPPLPRFRFIPRQSSFVGQFPTQRNCRRGRRREAREKTRDGARGRSKREDTSVTHESKLNNTAKSCINHPR